MLPGGDISVGGSLSLDGGALRVRGRIDVGGVFSAAEGTVIELGEGCSVRIVTDSATGRQSLLARERTGMLLIVK